MADPNETQESKAEKIPVEDFKRFDGNTQYQLKAIIECKPRIGLSSYFEKVLGSMITLESEGTFSRIEIIANCPTTSKSGNLIMNAFYNKSIDEKASYLFGQDYTDVVKLKKEFNMLAEKIKGGYPKSCVYFRRIHSKRIVKPQDSKS